MIEVFPYLFTEPELLPLGEIPRPFPLDPPPTREKETGALP